MAFTWRNIADIEAQGPAIIKDEDMVKSAVDKNDIELSTFIKFLSGPLDTTSIEEIWKYIS